MLDEVLSRFLAQTYNWADRNAAAYNRPGFDRDRWRAFCDLGIVGALFDPAAGGFAGEAADIALVFEALGRHLVVEPFLPVLMVGTALAKANRPEEIASLIVGEAIITFATEDDPAASVVASAISGGWRLTGAKANVACAGAATAFAVTAATADGESLFLIPADRSGLSIAEYQLVDGGWAGDVGIDVRVDPGDLIGPAGGGALLVRSATEIGLLALSAEALGAMETAKAMTIEHLQTREQFGLVLGRFQALQHRLVDMVIEIEQMRSAAENAAAAIGGPPQDRSRALARAKVSAGTIGRYVAEESIQMHGGIGMAWETPLSHVAKRLVMLDCQLGSADQHLHSLIQGDYVGEC